MKNYKALYAINAFTDSESHLFEIFLKSPYFNTRKKPIELFRIVNKNRNKPELTKEQIYKKLYSGKKFNANTYNDLMAQLFKLVEEFIYQEINKSDYVKKDITLLDKYLASRYKSLFESKKKQLEKRFANEEKIDTFYFWYNFLFEAIQINYLQTYNVTRTPKDIKKLTEHLHKCTANTTNLFVNEMGSMFFSLYTRVDYLKDKGSELLIKEIPEIVFNLPLPEILKPFNKDHNSIELIKNLLNLHIKPLNKSLYFKFKKSLLLQKSKLNKDEYIFYFSYLMGQCRTLVNKHNGKLFGAELKSLYKELIKERYYSSEKVKHFRPPLFVGLLKTFLTMKDIPAIEELIKTCVPLLEIRYREFYKNLAKSYIFFLQKNYEKSLTEIAELNTNLRSAEHDSRTHLIKLHYHLGDIEQVISQIGSYRKYINANRNKNSPKFKTNYNFLKYIEKLTLEVNKPNKNEIEIILNDLRKEDNISQKQWLLEIGQDILNKKSRR